MYNKLQMAFAKIIDNGWLDDISKKALVVVKEERDSWSFVWDVIEEYCESNKLIISNMYELIGDQDHQENIYRKVYNII